MNNPVRVLCFYEPSFFSGSAGCARPDLNAEGFFGRFVVDGMSKVCKADVRTVIPSTLGYLNKKTHVLDRLIPVEISSDELFSVFTNAKSLASIYLTIYNDSYTSEEKSAYENLIKRKLAGWTPDLIVTYPIHNNILKGLYPSALSMQMEFGIFSRFPSPTSVKLDPIHYANAFAARFRNQINAIKLSPGQRKTVDGFTAQLRDIFKPKKYIASELAACRQRYAHLVLLPIPAVNTYKESEWDDQVAFLQNVMEKIPKDIGVILTFHDTVTSQINGRTIAYFQSIYPNLIYFNPDPKAISPAASINYFSQVDAVLNCCSMTGIQALVFGSRLVSLDKTYSAGYADHIGLEGLNEFLNKPIPDHAPLIYWLLTRASIFCHQIAGPDDGESYYEKMIRSFRMSGISFDLFPEIDSIENVTKHILDVTRFNIRIVSITRHIPYPILFVERKLRKIFHL